MIIKNKGYASFLVIVIGYQYEVTDKGIEIGIDLETHDKLNKAYKSSVHNKIQKLHNKFLNIQA